MGDGKGSAFNLDVNEIGGAQEKRVLPEECALDEARSPSARQGRPHQTWNDSPQPQLPVEFGLLKRKPEPMMSST